MTKGWQNIGGEEYFLDYKTGEMRTGEIESEDGYHYLNDDGTMFAGWRKVPGTDDKWYYYDDKTGVRRTGWAPYYDEEEGKIEWYYLGEDNKLKTGWLKDGEKWYYLYGDTGYMATGKAELGGKMYYFDKSGDMKIGWIQDSNGNWYYADSNGVLQTDSVTIDGVDYYFDSADGHLQTDDADSRNDGAGTGPTLEEAADIAEHVYFEDFYSASDNTLLGGWHLTDHYDNGSLQIGVYSRIGVYGKTEYVLANRGSRVPDSFDNLDRLEDWKNNVKQFVGESEDVENSRNYVEWFIKKHPSADITFVGHSKGGAEAIINAVDTGKNAIVFNPAAPNLADIGLSASEYNGKVTSYVVKGEILNEIEGAKPLEEVGEVKYLRMQYISYNLENAIKNHMMDAVKSAINQYSSESN